MRSLLKSTAIYGVGAFLTKAFGFFLIPLYTRYFSVEEYGILAILNIIIQFVSYMTLLGISSAAMRHFFDDPGDQPYQKELYGNAFILIIIFPPIIILFLTPGIYLYVEKYMQSISFFPYIFLVLLISIFLPLKKLAIGLMRMRKQALQYVIYNFSFFLIQTIAIIYAVAFLKKGLVGQLYSQLFTNIVYFSIAFYLLYKYSIIRFNKEITKRLLYFGIPLLPFFFFTWINEASGRLFLESFGSLRDVGLFALAMQFAGLLNIVMNAFDNALLPFYYETASKENASEEIGKLATNIVAIFGIIILLILVVSKPVILIMANSSYHEAIYFIPLLLLANSLNVLIKLFHLNLMFNKKTKIISFQRGISAISMVSCLYIFLAIFHGGVFSIAASMIFVNTILIVMSFFISQRFFKVNYEKLKIIKLILLIFSTGLIITLFNFDDKLYFEVLLKLGIVAVNTYLITKIIQVGKIREILRRV